MRLTVLTVPIAALGALLLTVALPLTSAVASTRQPPLVPAPRGLEVRAGHAVLSDRWEVVLAESTAADAEAAAALVEDVRVRFGWSWRISARTHVRNTVTIAAGKAPVGLPHPMQAYSLEVQPTRIVVTAPTIQGRFYGIQTLRQLVRGSASPRLGCLSIADSPEMAWRGVSDDVSRGQMSTTQDFEEILAHLAFYKINLYCLYLEDVLATKSEPSLGLTSADLDRIARAAARHHITVVPILQSFGYNPMVLEGYESPLFRNAPWFARRMNPRTPSGLGSPLPPASTRALLAAADTLATRLPSPWFNIGGDELGTFGLLGSDARTVAEDGSTHLELAHYLADHLAVKHRRATMVYGDFVLAKPLVLKGLRKDIIVVDWNYYPDQAYTSVWKLRDAGFDRVFVSTGLWTWNAFYPDYDRAFRNVAAFTDTGKVHGALGAIVSSWGDNGSENLRENNWPGYALGAAAAWESTAPAGAGFLDDFSAVEYGAGGTPVGEVVRLLGWRDLGIADYAGRMVHRLPRVRLVGEAHHGRMTRLSAQMRRALLAIDRTGTKVVFNPSQLDGLQLAARRYLLFADRELALHSIAEQLADREICDLPEAQRQTILTELSRLADDARSVAADFQRLWVRTNRVGGMNYSVKRLARETDEYQALLTRARRGTLRIWKLGETPRDRGTEVASSP